MTEQEWLWTASAWDMIHFVRTGASKRKMRLFTCACCRQALNPFAPVLVERAVSAAESFADGEIATATLARVREAVTEAVTVARGTDPQARIGYLCHLLDGCLSACGVGDVAQAASDAALATARAVADMPWPATGAPPPEFAAELENHAGLMRDIFGNPFYSVGLEIEWLTETVRAMAKGIYTGHAFDQLPILADALQDAGCDDEHILDHCRNDREHVRGCWVVDLLVGKQ